MTKKESISWADLVKKVVFTSLGSAAMAKQVITDPGVSRDMLGGLLSRAEKTKEDLMNVLAREVSKFLGKINVSDEIIKALKGMVINLNASVDFKDKKEGLHPRVTVHSARVKKGTH